MTKLIKKPYSLAITTAVVITLFAFLASLFKTGIPILTMETTFVNYATLFILVLIGAVVSFSVLEDIWR